MSRQFWLTDRLLGVLGRPLELAGRTERQQLHPLEEPIAVGLDDQRPAAATGTVLERHAVLSGCNPPELSGRRDVREDSTRFDDVAPADGHASQR